MKHLKEEFDKLTFKEFLTYIIAAITMAAGLALLFVGMFIPPEGEIHGSVLSAFGMICVFVGALLNISLYFANELAKFKNGAQEQIDNLKNSMK